MDLAEHIALLIEDTTNKTKSQQIKVLVEHGVVITPNNFQRSKCFLVAKNTTIITHIMDCLNSFYFFS